MWLSGVHRLQGSLIGEKVLISIIKKKLSFPDDSVVKIPPAKQETWVQSLGQENPLEKKMATHSSIPAWEIP